MGSAGPHNFASETKFDDLGGRLQESSHPSKAGWSEESSNGELSAIQTTGRDHARAEFVEDIDPALLRIDEDSLQRDKSPTSSHGEDLADLVEDAEMPSFETPPTSIKKTFQFRR
jgi:hypothetical protein